LTGTAADDIKAAIAGAIMAYSAMEAVLERFIWDVTGLHYEDGRLLMRVDTSEKVSIAKALAARYRIETPVFGKRSLWRVMSELAEVRNRIAHGVWGMHEHALPDVSSFRLHEKGRDGRVVSEDFDQRRLAAITSQCEQVKDILTQMSVAARALRQGLVEQLARTITAPA
jgi:hypothetical protein